jgi:hypothetical protein
MWINAGAIHAEKRVIADASARRSVNTVVTDSCRKVVSAVRRQFSAADGMTTEIVLAARAPENGVGFHERRHPSTISQEDLDTSIETANMSVCATCLMKICDRLQ